MCGIVGFVNYEKNISSYNNVLNKMTSKIYKRGPDEDGYYLNRHVALGHKRLIVIDPNGGKQPMIEKHSYGEYVIVYNGQIYNTEDIKQNLIDNGFKFDTYSDTEVLLKAYIFYGKDVVHHLNGIFSFAIWNSKNEELFLARDHFGVKPLYYTFFDNTFIFASELKAIFEYPNIPKIVDKQGLSELFGIGPAHTPGLTIYKNIFEIKPAHLAILNKSGFHIERYWKLTSKPHTENFKDTCNHLRILLKDSINRQLVSDVPLCTFLSGGLDSSILTKLIGEYRRENGLPPVPTYSVDYVDNDKNFVKSDFQPNSDNYYINLMTENSYSENQKVILDTPDLADALEDAMIARDMPGMADVDSSLLLFCKQVKQEHTVTLMGECADEIFGGYPWFFRPDTLEAETFPWSIAIKERQQILNPSIAKEIDLKDYIDYRYNESLNEVEILETDSEETSQKRKISHLTINWFMQTLLERGDRMGMYNGLEIRVPFCDYRLAEYMWNVPWEIKALNGREKGLLRYVCKDFLPKEIVERKKSPYPKTHNPTYLARVKSMLSKIMSNSNAPINSLLNRKYILEILETNGKAFSRPWFGQLMTGPQLIAYLCQVNMWLEKYNPKVEL